MGWIAECAKGDSLEKDTGDIAGVIRRAKAQEGEACTHLYHFAVTPVYRYLSARLSTAEEAEELTQEVLVAAFMGIHRLRAEDEIGLLAWLFQIARNKLTDHLRQRYRRPSVPLDEVEQIEAHGLQPDEVAEAGEERASLRRALDKLTAEQREVILCKYVLEYDNERTARLVGKTTNAVNQLHHRALASLQRLIKGTEAAT